MGIAVYNKEPLVLISAMESYFKSTPPDCSLFSDDNYGILIHKELMYQTKYMREMIGTVGIDSKIEVFCPSLSKEELEIIVDFFYNGKIFYTNQAVVSQVSKNLEELFGFPLIQVETSDTKESILPLETRKQAKKILLTSESIRHDFPETAIKVEREVDYQDDLMTEDLSYQWKDDYEDVKVKEEEELIVDHEDDPLSYEVKGGSYNCQICNHKLGSRTGLRDHIRQVHEGMAKCPICEKVFKGSKTMNRHIRVIHKGSPPEKSKKSIIAANVKGKVMGIKRCPYCKQIFESIFFLMPHVEKIHPDRKIFDCQFCELRFLNKKRLSYHLSRKHSDQNSDGKNLLPGQDFKGSQKMCRVCKQLFKSRTVMMKHHKSTHPEAKSYDCSLCDFSCLTLHGINRHMFVNHERKKSALRCSFCGKDFKSRQELISHKQTEHKDKKYQCSKCEFACHSQTSLLKHIECVHEGKKYQCPTCGEVYETIARLESHVAQKHDRSQLFECPSCKVSYVREIDLKEHIAFVHDKVIGHLCTECGETFRRKCKLKDHILVVHEGKVYKCQVCSKTFNQKLSLQGHIRRDHKGKKPEPVKCSQCEKIFSSAGGLKRHVGEVHEGKRPYACHLCGLSFGQSGNLKTHMKGKHRNVF